MSSTSRASRAFTAPFFLFILLLALSDGIRSAFKGSALFVLQSPQYWVFSLQTILCGGLMIFYWREYELAKPRRPWFALIIGALVFAIWVSPQELFGAHKRFDGFDPGVFSGLLYFSCLTMRFMRLVVVVPLLEEIFWRGFLLRYLAGSDFERVPFGSFAPMPFAVVTVLFALEHSWADFWPALVTGALYNLVAYRTRSLSACVLAHALTNLLLGIYVMHTRQWGFW
jgi:CAAX prenyl protease-like protein